MKEIQIPIEISARHIHVTQEDLEILFGDGYKLSNLKDISQPNQFAAEEVLKLVGPKATLSKVRIVGPVRNQSQVELAATDCFQLGIESQVFRSGDLKDSPGGLTLVGSKGKVELNSGVIVAQRHLHISPKQAEEFGLKHLDNIKIRTNGMRGLIFDNVVVRSREGKDELAVHLDTDEANAAGVKHGDQGWLVK